MDFYALKGNNLLICCLPNVHTKIATLFVAVKQNFRIADGPMTR